MSDDTRNEQKAKALAHLSGQIEEMLHDKDEVSSEKIKNAFNHSLEKYGVDDSILRIDS